MTNHPNRSCAATFECRYFDGAAYQTIEYTARRSMAGYVRGPEYRVSYLLADGSGWLNGLRHQDRGDLMTGVEIVARPWVRGDNKYN